jgi:tetratricopeptide (TPR) repeat protein
MTPHSPRATARLNAGTAAFRAGDYARARREFERALALARAQLGPDHPQTLRTLSDLGAACAALGDHEASRAAHEAALAGRRRTIGQAHQDVGVSLHNLGAARAALGQDQEAADAHQQAIAIWRATLGETHPIIARARTSLAALARKHGDPQHAIGHTRDALHILHQQIPPDHAAIAAALDELATAQSQAGEEQAALATWQQALRTPGAPGAKLLVKLGLSHRRLGDLEGAATCFAAALRDDDTLTAARHHLAAVLTRLGRADEARPHLQAALQRERIFIQPGPPGAPRVLILATATEGNIPLDYLLPEAQATRIWWFIDHAPDPRAETLPAHDVVFNAIGDPDMTGAAEPKLAAFLAINDKKLLNDPARVARTRRDRLAARLDGIDGLVIPRICRIEGTPSPAAIMQAAREAGIAPPLLLRPAGAHGGLGVLRIEDWDAFDAPSAPAWYATAFHDCRSADGHTRKYRVIFVDRVPYAYHLAISPDWLVHYFSADMESQAWKLDEEAAFLADPRAVLGEQAFAALHESGARLDLDYCGMDFGMVGGRIVVFEANPTMLVHPETEAGPLAFKNPAVSSIVAAMNTLLRQE